MASEWAKKRASEWFELIAYDDRNYQSGECATEARLAEMFDAVRKDVLEEIIQACEIERQECQAAKNRASTEEASAFSKGGIYSVDIIIDWLNSLRDGLTISTTPLEPYDQGARQEEVEQALERMFLDRIEALEKWRESIIKDAGLHLIKDFPPLLMVGDHTYVRSENYDDQSQGLALALALNKDLSKKASELVDIVSRAAPLGWAASGDMEAASEWEKEAWKAIENLDVLLENTRKKNETKQKIKGQRDQSKDQKTS
jgi:hypothetical protein